MGSASGQEQLGRYRLVRRLAVGGMGEIFLARERGVAGFDRTVVVKRLLPELAERGEMLDLFLDEARIAAHLTHPNIVQIYELGREGDAYFIAMEYVPGQNLARICERAARDPRELLTRDLAVHVCAELAHGLDVAHHATDADGRPLGIVHRDVSPHNLLLSLHGDVKVMDFGIAKAANALHRTQTGVVRGKYAYMAPEQIAGKPVGVTADVYAAGVVLWELTTKRRLHDVKDEVALLDRVRAGAIRRPTEVDPTYPADLEAIVMRALEIDPARRTPDAATLAAELRGWLTAHHAKVERAALGAVVTTLFPEIDHVAPLRESTPAAAGTASLPRPLTASTTPDHPLIAVEEGTEIETPSVVAAEVTAPPAITSRRLVALGLVAAATGGIAIYLVAREPSREVTPAAAGELPPAASPDLATTAPATATSPRAAAPPERTPPAPQPEQGTSKGSATERARSTPSTPHLEGRVSRAAASPGRAAAQPVERAPRAGSAIARPTSREPTTVGTRVPAAPGPPPDPDPVPLGTLIVDATPWATVTIPGLGSESTPRRVKLAPGSHSLTIELPEGAGTLHGIATVRPNATTKCVASREKGLACR